MADWDICYNWMMDNEDMGRAYKPVSDPVPVRDDDPPEVRQAKLQAKAISGINSFYFPSQYMEIFNTAQPDRGPLIQNFYETAFWNNWFSRMESNEATKRVFDYAVNGGSGKSVRTLQEAIRSTGNTSIEADGKWGPLTLAAANSSDEALLVSAFQAQRLGNYQDTPAIAHLVGTAENPGPLWKRAMK